MKDATLKKNRKLLKKGGVVIFASAILIGASQTALASQTNSQTNTGYTKDINYDPCKKVIKAREEAREAWRQEYVSNYNKTVGQDVNGEIENMTRCTIDIMDTIQNIENTIKKILSFSGSISAGAIAEAVRTFIDSLIKAIKDKACKIIDNKNDEINKAIKDKFDGFLDQFTYKKDLPYDLGTVSYDPRTGFGTSGIISGDKRAIDKKVDETADDIVDPFKKALDKALPLGAR